METTDWHVVDAQNRARWRSARTRARWAMLLVALVTAVIGLEIAVFLHGFSFVDRFGRVPLAEVSAWQRNLNTVTGLYLASIVPAAIAVLAWLSRVVDNIPALTGTDPWVTPRWSIGRWFVPLANFVAPYRIVADAWRRLASRPAQRGTELVLAWWILWIGGGLVGQFLSRTAAPAPTPSALSSFLSWATGALVANVVAGILFIWIIRTIERRSATRAAENAARDQVPEPAAASPALSPEVEPTPG
jgi:hypothetical protein